MKWPICQNFVLETVRKFANPSINVHFFILTSNQSPHSILNLKCCTKDNENRMVNIVKRLLLCKECKIFEPQSKEKHNKRLKKGRRILKE